MPATEKDNICLSPLDQKLQDLACGNWHAFVTLVGPDAISNAKVCLLRNDKKSLQMIAHLLKITKRKAQVRSKKCNC